MTDLDERLRTAYEIIAPRYARVNAVMPTAVAEAAQTFMSMLPDEALRTRILDLGCGCGRDLTWFAQRCNYVTGIDLSMDMLMQAQALNLSSLAQANMLYLPVKSQAFDGIWANASLVHIPKDSVVQVLRECYRVMLKGAMIFIAMQVGDDEVWEVISYGQRAPRFFARYYPGEFRVLLEKVGFSIHQCDEQYLSPKRQWMHFYAYKTS